MSIALYGADRYCYILISSCCVLHSAGGWNWSTEVSFYQLLSVSQRGCGVWLLGLMENSLNHPAQLSSGLQTGEQKKRPDLQKALVYYPSPEFPLATLTISGAQCRKYCKSFQIKDLNASAKARPYRFFSVENAASGSHSHNSPPSRCTLTNCREFVVSSVLGDPLVPSIKYNLSSNLQWCCY